MKHKKELLDAIDKLTDFDQGFVLGVACDEGDEIKLRGLIHSIACKKAYFMGGLLTIIKKLRYKDIIDDNDLKIFAKEIFEIKKDEEEDDEDDEASFYVKIKKE